jgi:predicted aconitase
LEDRWGRQRARIEAEHVDLDVDRIVECFHRHEVEFLIVGGVAARLHGAQYPTGDFDSLPRTDEENLTRLAAALNELGAFLRVEGLTDDEARQLPVVIDASTLASMDLSTWRTDAGDIDILIGLPTRSGGRASYDHLVERADHHIIGTTPVNVAALEDVIDSKEWSNRPKDREALDELRCLRHRR